MYISAAQKHGCIANLAFVFNFMSAIVVAISAAIALKWEVAQGDFITILCWLGGFTISIFCTELLVATIILIFVGLRLGNVASINPSLLIIVGVFLIANSVMLALYVKNHYSDILQRKVFYRKKLRKWFFSQTRCSIYFSIESFIVLTGVVLLILSMITMLRGENIPVKSHQYNPIIYIVSITLSVALALGELGWFLLINVYESQKIEDIKSMADETDNQLKKRILNNHWAHLAIADLNARLLPRLKRLQRKYNKNSSPEIGEKLKMIQAEYDEEINKLNDKLIDVDGEITTRKSETFYIMCEAYKEVMKCKKTWRILSCDKNTEYKSFAKTTVDKETIKMGVGVFSFLQSHHSIPAIPAQQGYTIYIYPEFIIKAKSITDFEAFSINSNNVFLYYTSTRFVEEQKGPSDAELLGYTYRYVNADGSRDHRFNLENNPNYYVYRYGDFMICPFGDLYEVSNYEAASLFCRAFAAL